MSDFINDFHVKIDSFVQFIVIDLTRGRVDPDIKKIDSPIVDKIRIRRFTRSNYYHNSCVTC